MHNPKYSLFYSLLQNMFVSGNDGKSTFLSYRFMLRSIMFVPIYVDYTRLAITKYMLPYITTQVSIYHSV